MASSYFDTDFISEYEIDEEWKEKFPIRHSLWVKVSSIVSPSKFWVTEVPLSSTKTGGYVNMRIREIEKSLGLLYHDMMPKAEPEGYIKDLKVDMLVACRPSYR